MKFSSRLFTISFVPFNLKINPIQSFNNAFTLNNPLQIKVLESNEIDDYLLIFAFNDDAEILTEYFYTARDIGNVEGITSYSIEKENFINMSNLSDTRKIRLLVTMSIFRNSINFWAQ